MRKEKGPNIKPNKKPISKKNESSVKWIFCIALFLFAFVLYGHTLGYGFVLDDDLLIRLNYYVLKGIKGIPQILSNGFLSGYSEELNLARPQYRPLVLVHLAIEKQLWGINPTVNHFFNVFYYGLTGVLLFLLLRKVLTDVKPIVPFLISMLFLAHPIHTEVVANIKSRDEILSFLFLLLSLLTLYQYITKRKRALMLISVISFFLSILSKESALTFLAVIPLFLYCFSKEKLNNIFRLTAPYLAPVVAFFILRLIILPRGLPQEIDPLYNALLAIPSLSHRLATAILIIGKYLRLLVVPHPLVWDYSYNQVPEAGWESLSVLLSVAICVGLATYALVKIKSRDVFAFCILYFFIALSLTSNIFIYIGSTMAERFLYVPSLGFCIVLFFILKKLTPFDDVDKIKMKKPALFYSLISVILIAYSYKTIVRASDWKDNMSLFLTGVRDSPNSAKTHFAVAGEYTNSAKAATDAGIATQLYQKAIEGYYTGLKIYPKDAEQWFNLGVVYFDLKNFEEAEKMDRKAIAINPRYAKAYNNIGVIQAQRGEYKLALPNFEKAAAIDSNYVDALGNIASCYNMLGDYKKADFYFKKAMKINPNNENINRNMEGNNMMLEMNAK